MRETKAIVVIVLVLAVAFIAPAMAQQNNVISIGDVQAAPSESITAPILINNATGIAGIKIKLSYNPTIVNVTDYTLGDFNDMDNTDISTAQDGYVVIWVIEWSPQSGDKTVANVELTAVGSASDTSDLNISILSLKDDCGLEVADRSTEKGTFTILNGPGPTPTPTPTPTPSPTPTPGGSGGVGGVGGGGGGGGGSTIIQTPTPTPTANNTLNDSDSSVDCGDSGTCCLTNEAPENIVLTEVTSLNVSKGKNMQKMPAQAQTQTPTPTEPTITETTTETENKLISIPRFYAIFGLVGLLIIAYRFRRKPS